MDVHHLTSSQPNEALTSMADALPGLGIVAVTWIALKERTREIGIRRALGATRHDIFFQVFVETATLGVTGSLFGVVFSWSASHLISESAGLPFVFEGGTVAFALTLAVTLNRRKRNANRIDQPLGEFQS